MKTAQIRLIRRIWSGLVGLWRKDENIGWIQTRVTGNFGSSDAWGNKRDTENFSGALTVYSGLGITASKEPEPPGLFGKLCLVYSYLQRTSLSATEAGLNGPRVNRTRDLRTHGISDFSKGREIHVKDVPVVNRASSITSITGAQLAKFEPWCGTENRFELIQPNNFVTKCSKFCRITIFYAHSETVTAHFLYLISEWSCLMFGPIRPNSLF